MRNPLIILILILETQLKCCKNVLSFKEVRFNYRYLLKRFFRIIWVKQSFSTDQTTKFQQHEIFLMHLN
jgi:hypothetical protein